MRTHHNSCRITASAFSCLISVILYPGTSQAQIIETKLTPRDNEAGDWFGYSVSISADYGLVGAPKDVVSGEEAGSAYIFRHKGTGWLEEAELTASDGKEYDNFGRAVSISGDYAVIGMWEVVKDTGATPGSVYIFRREGTSWVEEAILTASDGAPYDAFGYSVSISGDYAALGRGNDYANGGSAYIFRREGTNWVEEMKLTASNGSVDDDFGWSISISGDFVVVGAPGDNDNGTNAGSAYVFTREGTNWVEQQKLTASDGVAYDGFGYSVSNDGDYAVIGARFDPNVGPGFGSAYVFRREEASWIEEAKLTASDGAAYDGFGFSVSISGDYTVVGSYNDDDNGVNSGSVYLYRHEGTNWVEEAKITASDGASFFGWSVSISGDYAVVGAFPGDDAYVYSSFSTPSSEICIDFASGNFAAKCNAVGTISMRFVLLNNIDWNGTTIKFVVDGVDTVSGTLLSQDPPGHSRVSLQVANGYPAGDHTVTMIKPDCGLSWVVNCRDPNPEGLVWGEDELIKSFPEETKLIGNYPNPFNPSTSINYALSEDGFVSLKIYNTLGEEVLTLVNEVQAAGYKSAKWNGRTKLGSPVTSGIYMYRLTAGSQVQTGKMLLVK